MWHDLPGACCRSWKKKCCPSRFRAYQTMWFDFLGAYRQSLRKHHRSLRKCFLNQNHVCYWRQTRSLQILQQVSGDIQVSAKSGLICEEKILLFLSPVQGSSFGVPFGSLHRAGPQRLRESIDIFSQAAFFWLCGEVQNLLSRGATPACW